MAKESKKGLIAEFKEFIMRGNVLDLAVGVVMGTAFGNIVTSLVNNIIMPFVGCLFNTGTFAELQFTINETPIMYGAFIQSIVDFLIVALCIFVFIKLINKLFMKKKEEPKEEAPKTPEDILLLREIRNLLKEKKK